MATRKNIPARARRAKPTPTVVIEIRDVRQRLEGIHACVLTVIAALREQAADNNTVFAACLMGCAANPLSVQMERLDSVVTERAERPNGGMTEPYAMPVKNIFLPHFYRKGPFWKGPDSVSACFNWRPHGDSNPGYHRERVMS